MEINYHSCSSLFFYPFEIAHRHFQVAFMANDPESLKTLEINAVIQETLQTSIPLLGRVKHFILGISEYLWPVSMIIALVDRYFNHVEGLNPEIDIHFRKAILATPKFQAYTFEGHPQVHVTDLSIRPANLFLTALFGDKQVSTQPGEGLFTFKRPLAELSKQIFDMPPDQVISFSPGDEFADLFEKTTRGPVNRGARKLATYLGNNTYQISAGEIQEMLQNCRIYLSPLIPKEFYLALKTALTTDGYVALPGEDSNPLMMQAIIDSPEDSALKNLLAKAKADPTSYGFIANGTMLSFDELIQLNLYQIGAMVIKTDDYRSLIDEGYQLKARSVGEQDGLTLISACGIRGFSKTTSIPGNAAHELDRKILTQTFQTSLKALKEGATLVMPAVGMGVWRGDPAIYWRAILDAIVSSGDALETIFINPAHQKTLYGSYKGCQGDEFAKILAEYKAAHPESKSLLKVVNLFDRQTDLFLLAQNLKKACPEKTIALFNASDPDVTLGNHIGEYVNNLCHPSTTEEHDAALGTSLLLFEGISKILEHPVYVIQD